MRLSRNRSLRLGVKIMEEESQDPIGYHRCLLFGVLSRAPLTFRACKSRKYLYTRFTLGIEANGLAL